VSRTTSGFAQWRPDPFRRFELRRFFLDQPTSLVMNGSLETYDAVGPLLMSDQRLSANSSLASGQAHESSGAVAIGNDPIAEQVQEETPPSTYRSRWRKASQLSRVERTGIDSDVSPGTPATCLLT